MKSHVCCVTIIIKVLINYSLFVNNFTVNISKDKLTYSALNMYYHFSSVRVRAVWMGSCIGIVLFICNVVPSGAFIENLLQKNMSVCIAYSVTDLVSYDMTF